MGTPKTSNILNGANEQSTIKAHLDLSVSANKDVTQAYICVFATNFFIKQDIHK